MIEFEDRDAVTIVRMARGKGNALNLDLLRALADALEDLKQWRCRAAVITGQGSVFCAGVDLTALAEGGPSYVQELLPLMVRGFEQLATFPKPLVGAINGHAIAGGAILMCACDQRILARGNARIGVTEVLVGVPFPAWALEIVRFATPPQHFPTLVCTGRTWPAEEALGRGLVDELVEPERLLDRACAVAEELGSILPSTFTATKLAVRRPMIEAAKRQTAAEMEAMTADWCSEEVRRQVAAFVRRTLKRSG